MNHPYKSEELFGKYAAEVGNFLPRRERSDIEIEILSLLEDALEDKSEASGRPADETMALEVLREFGPPLQFSTKYRQNQYLIGPQTFPLFKIVLIAAVILFLVQFLIGHLFNHSPYPFSFLQMTADFSNQGFRIFGMVVFLFALIEHLAPTWPFNKIAASWEPASLTKDQQRNQIKPSQQWLQASMLFGLLLYITIFPQWVGFGNNANNDWSFIPVLSQHFRIFLPWIILHLLSRMILHVLLALKGNWDKTLQWLDIGTKALGVITIIIIISGPDFFGINSAYLNSHTYAPELLNWFESTLVEWNTAFRISLFFYLLAQIVIIVYKIIKMVIQRETVKFPTITTN